MCVPAINTPETRHGELRVVSKKGLVVDWKPFLTTTQEEVRRLKKIQQAVQLVGKLETQQNLYDTCNMYFTKLPRGKSLRELWKGGGVFISLWPNSPRGEFAVTHSNNKDITIASWCLDTQTVSMVAATVIHEMAHVAGAPGGDSHMAERAVDKCGFHDEYDPRLLGSLELYSYLIGRMG
jgi:hypothetical protein